MVRDLRSERERERYWETLHVIDNVNRGLFELQRALKDEDPMPPGEVAGTWLSLRDIMDRQVRVLAPEVVLPAPAERALSVLQEGVEKILGSWELSTSQRDRLKGLLSQARREHLGAEAAAA